MKIQKTIEVEVCDNCGTETSLRSCSQCAKQIGDCCTSYFAVNVVESEPDESKGWRFEHPVPNTNFHGAFCKPCSSRIREILTQAGLIKLERGAKA